MSLAQRPRTQRKRERTRGELVAAAEHLVAARGLDAVSIDDIVEAADVAKGTFYTHFADKNELAETISHRTRMELEDRITALNEGSRDAAKRMANGLSSMFAFAIANPVRARALLRLRPSVVDPEASMNAGLRGDVVLGLKSKRFATVSLDAAVVAVIGGSMAAILRLSDTTGKRVDDPYGFAADVVATLLVSLGLKQLEASRLAATAMNARKEELS